RRPPPDLAASAPPFFARHASAGERSADSFVRTNRSEENTWTRLDGWLRSLTLRIKPTNLSPLVGGRSSAWLEPQIVDLVVAGSNPVGHPIPRRVCFFTDTPRRPLRSLAPFPIFAWVRSGASRKCPRTADGPRPQHVGPPRRTAKNVRAFVPGHALRTGTVRDPAGAVPRKVPACGRRETIVD